MKKLYIFLLLLPFYAHATVYTSVANGDWATATTWSPNGLPGASDTVIINNSVTVNVAAEYAFNLTINSGGTLSNSQIVGVLNLATNNVGGTWKGTGNVGLCGPVNGTVLKGGGSFSSQSGSWYLQGNSAAHGTQTIWIDATVNFSRPSGLLVIYTGGFHNAIRVLNFGKIVQTGGYLLSQGGLATSWTQEANSTLEVSGASIINSYDTLNASAAGNTVEFSGSSAYTIKTPKSSTFYNLTLDGTGTKTLPTTLSVNNFTATSNATVNFNSLGMNVAGNWSKSGTLTNFTGTINFNGTSAQSIGGTKSTRFANITISGSGNVTLNTNSAFTGIMTLTGNGNLASAGGIVDTLVSTSAKTARVAQIAGSGTITANFVVQRYDGRSTANYEILSSPVVSTTLGDWNTSNRSPAFYMSGVGGPDGNAGSYVSVYIYGETTNSYNAVTTITSPGINYVLPQAQGIYLWMGNSLTTATPFTYITHGVPSTGTVNKAVTFTASEGAGFNMVGNPYPSPISWASVAGNNASLQNAFYLFEQDGSWHTFIGGSFIPMEQGFGVVTTSSTTIQFKESFKSSTDAALQRPEKGIGDPMLENNSVTFTLSNDVNSYSCPTTISFGSGYNTSYLPSEDAIFIKSFIKEVPQLYTSSADTRSLTLNRLPNNSQEIDVPVTAVGNVAGNYVISTDNLTTNLASYDCVSLVDNETGATVNNFEENPSYGFKIAEAGEIKHFTIKFIKLQYGESCSPLATATLPGATENIQIYSSSTGAVVNFHLAQQEDATISIFTVTGQQITGDIHTNAYNNEITIPLSTHAIYIVRVVTANGVTNKKLFF